MLSALGHRICGVWDLDNTLYKDARADGTRISDHFIESFIVTAQALLPGLGEEEIVRRMNDSYRRCGMSSGGFADLAAHHGHTPAILREALHSRTSRRWFQVVTDLYPDHFQPCPETVSAFERLSGWMRHGCLSHSCTEHWVGPVMEALGLKGFFNEVMGAGAYGFHSKQLSTIPLETMLERLEAEPQESFFVEDSLVNLEKAKDLDSRIFNILIHHGAPPDPLPSYLDWAVENHLVAVRALEEAHRTYRPKVWIPVGPVPALTLSP
ncbi:MAG TPA: HAD hydrolase-like protein [Alphaproteobacteria bacterium]|nr:HAD hydrolase-like protein [Alphaproteobacteria bacterium]